MLKIQQLFSTCASVNPYNTTIQTKRQNKHIFVIETTEWLILFKKSPGKITIRFFFIDDIRWLNFFIYVYKFFFVQYLEQKWHIQKIWHFLEADLWAYTLVRKNAYSCESSAQQCTRCLYSTWIIRETQQLFIQ